MRNKSTNGLVNILYKDEKYTGHLQLDENVKEFKIFIDSSSNYYEELTQIHSNKYFDFHCELLNGRIISLFNCLLIHDTHAGDIHELTFKINLYIDFEVKSLKDFKIKKLSAIFPYLHTLFTGSGDALKFSVDFKFEGYNIKLETNENIKSERSLFISNKTKAMNITLKSAEGLPLDIVNEFYFRFSTIVSFMSNHFITYENYFVSQDDNYFYINNEMQSISTEYGPPSINNYNYRFSSCTDQQFKEHIINPILSENFYLWLNYSSTLRFSPQLIEEKFLTYFRCIESIADDRIDSKLYQKREIKNMRKKLEEVMPSLEFTEDDIEYIKDKISHGNRKFTKDMIIELIEKEFDINLFHKHGYFPDHTIFIKNLTKLRHDLSHGNEVHQGRLNNLINDIFSLKEIVVILLLREQGLKTTFPLHYYEFKDLKKIEKDTFEE